MQTISKETPEINYWLRNRKESHKSELDYHIDPQIIQI